MEINKKILYSKITLKEKEMENQEKEFYSKLQVAGSIKFVVGEKSDEIIGLKKLKLTNNEKFSHNLAIILARKGEVVAVNLTTYPNNCIICISKNSRWLEADYEYINKIQEFMLRISKYEPMTWKEAFKKNDTKALSANVITYCSEKFDLRFKKLKKDIRDGKNNQFIQSFLKYTSNLVNINNAKNIASKMIISKVCYYYYKKVLKNDEILKNDEALKKFLKHLKKVGSYMRALIDITTYACNKNYKNLFSNIELHILRPIITHQSIFSWRIIIKKFVSDCKYEIITNICLNNRIKACRLATIYGTKENLKRDEIIKNGIYLHAEMNILNEIINQRKKTRTYIAVSKKCYFLCELYIKFAQEQGYNAFVFGAYRKMYNLWKLPSPTDITFKSNFLKYALNELDRIIQEEVNNILKSSLLKSDSDKANVDSDQINVDDDKCNDLGLGNISSFLTYK
jgi:hypothetical protein